MRKNFIVISLLIAFANLPIVAQERDPAFERYKRAQQRYAKGDFTGAIADFTEVIHGNLGWVLWRLGKEAEAEKEFTECFRLDPSLKPTIERRIREARLKLTS